MDEFERSVYRAVAADVRRHDPTIKLRDAWVWKASGTTGSSTSASSTGTAAPVSAYDARAAGWAAYLASMSVAGYARPSDEEDLLDLAGDLLDETRAAGRANDQG